MGTARAVQDLLLKTRSRFRQNGGYNLFAQQSLKLESYLFDLANGVDTHANVSLSTLRIDGGNAVHGRQYQPTAVSHMRQILKDLEIRNTDVLVDFGCGKGRVLLMASVRPFSRVVGVEFSNELCQIAERNIRSFSKRKRGCKIDVICQDATSYEIRKDENVFFFFNPFDDSVMQQVVENIEDSYRRSPRQMRAVFHNFDAERLRWGPDLFAQVRNTRLHGLAFQIYATDGVLNGDPSLYR